MFFFSKNQLEKLGAALTNMNNLFRQAVREVRQFQREIEEQREIQESEEELDNGDYAGEDPTSTSTSSSTSNSNHHRQNSNSSSPQAASRNPFDPSLSANHNTSTNPFGSSVDSEPKIIATTNPFDAPLRHSEDPFDLDPSNYNDEAQWARAQLQVEEQIQPVAR